MPFDRHCYSSSQTSPRPLVLAAHPDDEVVSCSIHLQRCEDPVVVFLTDGAPRDDYFWRSHGSRHRYAAIRRIEAMTATNVLKIRHCEFLPEIGKPDEFVDQELHRQLPRAVEKLSALIEHYEPTCLVGPAYEGGHPDHDSCAFLLSRLSQTYGLPAYEFPLYHRSPESRYVRQEFIQLSGEEQALIGTPAELAIKRRAIAAYKSQEQVLHDFNWSTEICRPAMEYDFTERPHTGQLNYEAWQWPADGDTLVRAFRKYLANSGALPGRKRAAALA